MVLIRAGLPQLVELICSLQALIDSAPGAFILRVALAHAVLLAAAGAVDQALAAFGVGTDGAGTAQNSVAAHPAIFVENAYPLHLA